MSGLLEGLGRLLTRGEAGSAAQQKTAFLKPFAAATSPRQEKPRSLFRFKSTSPASQSQSPEQAAQQQQQQGPGQQLPSASSPGDVYASLPCIANRKPSRTAGTELAGDVQAVMPGVQLGSSWQVYSASGSPAGSARSSSPRTAPFVCILPELQPPGYFRSKAAVISFLQQLQDAGVPLPGVLDQPKAAPSPASAQRHAAAVTAALQSCGPGFTFIDTSDSVRDSTGSGDTETAAAPAAAAAGAGGAPAAEFGGLPPRFQQAGAKRQRELAPEQHLRQLQQLKEELKMFGGSDSLGGSEEQQQGGDEQQQRPQKRGRYSAGESSLERKSSGASPTSVSPHSWLNRPAAAAAGGAGAGRLLSQVSPGASDAAQPSPRWTAANASSGGAGFEDDLEALPAPLGNAFVQQLLQRQQQQRGVGADDVLRAAADAAGLTGGGHHHHSRGHVAAAFAGGAQDSGAAAAAAAGGSSKPLRAAKAAAAGYWLIHSDDSDSFEQQEEWGVLHRLQSLRSADPFVTEQGPKLNRVDAKLASLRRAAFVQGREPSLSAAMAAPLSHKPPKSPAAAAAAGANPFSAEGGKGKGLPPKPKPSRPSSGSSNGSGGKRQAATNTFTAASDVKSRNKLDSLLRAKEAAAAIKAAVQSGQQYEGTLEQRHHAMRQQLRNQLQDGRVPSAEGMAALQAALSAHLPGSRLDSEWLVYPATPADAVPKLDILIRHPKVTMGYFRSYRSVVNFYGALTELLKSSKGSSHYYTVLELTLPGLSILPDVLQQLQQQPGNKLGRSPGELVALMNKALNNSGRSFVRESAGVGATAAAGSPDAVGRRPSSPGDSENGMLYPAGGTRAAAANAAALTARQWQPPPLVANLEPPRKGSSVLVLGMFYASEATAMESHNGLAQYRDRIRLAALHKQVGYIPHSFDRDHEVQLAELSPDERGLDTRLHVQGNFNSKRGAAAVTARFPNTRFTAVFCDYFRMPSGYAGDIYKAQLFLDYIPELVRRGNLPAGVPIYIPNSPVLLEQLAASGAFVDYGDVVAVPARCYPLYEATRHAEVSGLMPAKYSNVGQVRELVPGAEFIVVHYCGDATPPMGP